MMLNRTTVTLYNKVEGAVDEFNRPVETDSNPITVSGCVVGQPTSDDVTNEMNLSGKRISYWIFIPNGDTHTWENSYVVIGSRKYSTIGIPVESFADMKMIPCNRKIAVEVYEQS
jgi:hypothetical protein